MLDEYSKLNDTISADPDYEPGEEVSSDEITSGSDEVDTEEEKTESQRKLNGKMNFKRSRLLRFSFSLLLRSNRRRSIGKRFAQWLRIRHREPRKK